MWGYASVRHVTGGTREHPDATSKSHQARMYWRESGRKSRTPALASSPSRTGHQRRDVAQRVPWGWGRGARTPRLALQTCPRATDGTFAKPLRVSEARVF